MTVQAYQRSVSRAENPRLTEYRLLAQVTQALMDIADCDRMEFSKRADALDWNKRVWGAFATDCSVDGNTLSNSLRAGIISLSLFVSKHSSAVMLGNADVEPLVDINRTVMQGLAQAAGVDETAIAVGA